MTTFYRCTVQTGSALDKQEDQILYTSIFDCIDRAIWILNNTHGTVEHRYCRDDFMCHWGKRTYHLDIDHDEIFLTIHEMKVHTE